MNKSNAHAVREFFVCFSSYIEEMPYFCCPLLAFISPKMAKVHSSEIPYLTPRQFEDGSGWYVEVYWIGRPMERLGRFAVFSEAHDWITLEPAAYFLLRELRPCG